jgi:hypothetical protein
MRAAGRTARVVLTDRPLSPALLALGNSTFARSSNPPASSRIINSSGVNSVAAWFCPRGKTVQTYKKEFVELLKRAAFPEPALPICRGLDQQNLPFPWAL